MSTSLVPPVPAPPDEDGVLPPDVEAQLARMEQEALAREQQPAPIVVRDVRDVPRTAQAPISPYLADVMNIAQAMKNSGYFTEIKHVAQAVSKILAGKEVGLGPFASMAGIYFQAGKPLYFSQVMASLIQSSGRFRYTVRESTATLCRIEFFERVDGVWESQGIAEWSEAKARQAKLWGKAGSWSLHPHMMLFYRAMSEGAKMYCPSVFNGSAYIEGEIEEEVPTTESSTES